MPMTIRRVPPGRGWQWIVQAFALFRKNPLVWLVLNLVLVAIGWLLGKVPVAGSYVLYLLAPIFLAGIMAACRDLEAGKDIEIGHLFRGFRQNTPQLVTVGGVHLVGQVLISGLMLSIGGPEFQEIAQSGEVADPATIAPETRQRILLALLVSLSLYLPLAMAVWFAPALAILDGQQGFRALVFSLIAGLRNLLPFLVYSLASTVLFVLAVIPFGVGLVLWLPVMVLTMYTSYRDVFVAAPAPATETSA
ncbi:MAG TPA: BPSS1780 family membrane protein [Burkholderiales bacterium]